MLTIPDIICGFYKNNRNLWKAKRNQLTNQIEEHGLFVTNYNTGLGDALSVSGVIRAGILNRKLFAGRSYSSHFNILQRYSELNIDFISHIEAQVQKKEINACVLTEHFDHNGHFIQQIHKSLGLTTPDLPRGGLKLQKNEQIQKNKVVLNFNAGVHSSIQKLTIHPRAREFYPEHKEIVQKFIFANSQYDFVEVGTEFSGLKNVINETGKSLNVAIDHLYQADFYLGIHSGITNLAAAIGVKSIVMLNFPNGEYIKLPQIVRLNLPDTDWLYPQNVHLHMDEDSDLCRIFSYQNLEKAFNGEIYPFFRQDYISLIHEKIQ